MTMRSVVAVSTSRPRWIDMNGVQTFTSLVRDESPVPLHFGKDGPPGNAMALHTEVAYAFPIEHYKYWGEEFGLDYTKWPNCFWGENLTVEGFHEDSIRIGDRLTFSRGAILEVTGPRTPCTKMSWRLGLPGSILKTLTRKGFLGFYLRIMVPGEIGANDTVEIHSPYPDNMSVGEIGRLLDRGTGADPELLRKALKMPALSEQTTEQLLHTIEHIKDLQRAKTGRWKGWRPFVISEIVTETADVSSYRLTPKDGKPVASFRAGQFLPVRVPHESGPLVRTWSLSEYNEDNLAYRLTIKHVVGGMASTWMRDKVTVGTELDIRPPAGQFVLERSGLRPIVLISAGIGVTPLLAMLRAHAGGRRPTPLTWIHSTRSSQTDLMRREINALLSENPLFERQVHYTQPLEQDEPGVDYDVLGRIMPSHLETLVSRPSRYVLINKEIELNGRVREFFVCGPTVFQNEVRDTLLKLGVSSHHIKAESFHHEATEQVAGDFPDAAEVVFARSGKSVVWNVDGFPSLLELAENAGVDIEFGCRSGSCGACSATLLEGNIDYLPNPTAEAEKDCIFLCCARPTSQSLIIDA